MHVATILNFERIAEIFATRYGIAGVISAIELPGSSTAHVWKVETPTAGYILKEFTPHFSLERVAHEPDLVMHLRRQNLPVAEFFATLAGDYTWLLEERAISVQSMLSGTPGQQCAASKDMLENSVKLLADLQLGMRDYPDLSENLNAATLARRYDTAVRLAKFEHFMDLAQNLPASERRDRILSDLSWKISRVEHANQISFDLNAFTYGNTHGDYNTGNLLLQGSTITGVIDFTNACRMPLVWELLRSYIMSSPECANGVIDIDSFAQYASWYGEKIPLTPYDLSMAGKLTYFQSVHSSFGYQEFLVNGVENADSVLGYAAWRVQIAQWLEAHMEDFGGIA